jgi:nicotinamidase-related amidase
MSQKIQGASLKHPSGINQKIVDKVVARRGRLHIYEHIDPAKTALVVVDLDSATTRRMGEDTDIMNIVKPINQIAAALRKNNGLVSWVITPIQKASDKFMATFGEKTAKMYEDEGKPGGEGTTIWHGLHTKPEDIYVTKKGSSAFFPGKCDLHEQLQKRGVDTLLIVGAVTNICCESSARDACELNYKVIMVSDAMQGHAWGLHEATLATFFRVFGDVRPASEVVGLVEGVLKTHDIFPVYGQP